MKAINCLFNQYSLSKVFFVFFGFLFLFFNVAIFCKLVLFNLDLDSGNLRSFFKITAYQTQIQQLYFSNFYVQGPSYEGGIQRPTRQGHVDSHIRANQHRESNLAELQ